MLPNILYIVYNLHFSNLKITVLYTEKKKRVDLLHSIKNENEPTANVRYLFILQYLMDHSPQVLDRVQESQNENIRLSTIN